MVLLMVSPHLGTNDRQLAVAKTFFTSSMNALFYHAEKCPLYINAPTSRKDIGDSDESILSQLYHHSLQDFMMQKQGIAKVSLPILQNKSTVEYLQITF